MSTPSSAVSNSRMDTPAVIPPAQRLYWLLRRELWENRSLYIAPLAVAGVFLFGFLISMFHFPQRMRAALLLPPMQQHALIERPYHLAALMIMGSTFIVAFFYCLDALHGERRDRSILFWKSLPVSDLDTVLSKALIPILFLPLLTFVITIVTQWLMLLISSVVLLGSGPSLAALWAHLRLGHMFLVLFYHLMGLHGLWYAPIFCWLLLVSCWARRVPFLWAALPLFVIGFVEKIAFNSSHVVGQLAFRISGGDNSASPGDPMSMDAMTSPGPSQLLSSPGLWIGLLFAAILLAAAVRLRRNREPL